MKTILYILFLISINFLFIPAGKAKDSKSLFQTANTYYQNKQYDEAEKLYLLVFKEDKNNANALYNLGNTYFHLQQYASAILYYEKAKKLEPDNKYILHNIELTNNKLFNKIEFSKEFFVTKKIKGIAHAKSSASWSIYLLVTFWTGAIMLCLHFFFSKRILFRTGILLCISALVFAYFTYVSYKSEHRTDFAIVMQENAPVKKAPVASINAAASVQAGTKVQILDSDKNWLKIKLPNDQTGWIEISSIAFI